MANVSRINGFRPVKHITGAPYNGQATIYSVPATNSTALYVGDIVKLGANANAAGVKTIVRATPGDVPLGVVVGIVPTKLDPVKGGLSTGSMTLDTPVYLTSSTAGYVLVADSPDIVCEAEAGTTTVTTGYSLTANDIGLNVLPITTAGSTVTGNSAMAVDMSTATTVNTTMLKILGVQQRVDNDFPSNTATKVLVMFNAHQLKGTTGSTGV